MTENAQGPERESQRAAGGGRANRLMGETSPYLRQHARNPVDWYPWGQEALERAKREGKPIFLSVGYAACHWCHVMEREVFEDEEIARIMNAHFVNIKVDREERPDVDEVYMLATQLMTGSGGWPMSVWLTPELEPFYAGTYFPARDGYGRPGFPRLTTALAEAWRERRGELQEQGRKVVEAVRQHADESEEAGADEGASAGADVGGWLVKAVEEFADRIDAVRGGLGSAPKFPPSQALALWLAMAEAGGKGTGMLEARHIGAVGEMLKLTLEGMMRGGMYDQVGGGFARYSTDEKWLVPHFEKMLYDNAQLAGVYAVASRVGGETGAEYARVARATLEFWLREMTWKEGAEWAFYSSLDADSEGEEGKYYVWAADEVERAAGNPEDARLIESHFGVTVEGNWEGKNVLHVARTAGELGTEDGKSAEEMQRRLDAIALRLREARGRRVRPGVDDKILTGWNGLMISALAVAGRVLGEERYIAAAESAVEYLWKRHRVDGRLLRTSRPGSDEAGPGGGGGMGHIDGYLEDYAYLLNGLVDLAEARGSGSAGRRAALERAEDLAELMLKEFEDRERGGFFFTTGAHDRLFARMKNAGDGAVPSANGSAIRGLLRLARVMGEAGSVLEIPMIRKSTLQRGGWKKEAAGGRYREAAMRGVRAFAGVIGKRPSLYATVLQGLVEAGAEVQSGDDARQEKGSKGSFEDTGVGAGGVLRVKAAAVGPVVAGKAEGSARELEVRVVVWIEEGYHIQLSKPEAEGGGGGGGGGGGEKGMLETVVRARGLGGLRLKRQEWEYPAGQEVGGGEVGHQGTIAIKGRCELADGTPAGGYRLRVVAEAQACREGACLVPAAVTVEIPVEVQ